MPDTPTETTHLASAALLMLDLDGWLRDCELRDSGKTVYYSVHTDAIRMFMSPPAYFGEADVFAPGGNNDDSILLAWLLADFLFLDAPLSQYRPFLLISPDDDELQRIADDLHRLIELNLEEDANSSIRKPTVPPEVSPAKPQQLAAWLREQATPLVRFLQDRRDGPEMELKRLADLVRNSSIAAMGTFVDPKSSNPLPYPNISEDSEDAERFLTEKAKWRERLNRHNAGRKSSYDVDRDAEVLTRMDWVNGELGDSARLVLITLAPYVFVAANEHDPQYAARFLRHPRCFLGHQRALAMPESSDRENDPARVKTELRLLDWLNLLFPDALKLPAKPDQRPIVDRKYLEDMQQRRDVVTKGHERHLKRPDEPGRLRSMEDLLSDWGTHIRNVAAARLIYPSVFDATGAATGPLAKRLFPEIDVGNGPEERSDPYQAAYCESVNTLSDLYAAPAWIGLWRSKRVRSEGIIGVPELRWDEDKEAQKYSSMLLASIRKGESAIDVPEVYRELERVDPTRYLAHVIHGLAYAAKGHWAATISLCRTAIAVCDCIPDAQRGHRLGREASYLAAVATRRTALSGRDLGKARRWLDQARERDRSGVDDCRFQSEAFAIEVSSYAFAYFYEGKEVDCAKAIKVYEDIGKSIEALKRNDKEREKKVKDWVLRQSLTNLYCVRFILLGQTGNDLPGSGESWLEDFDEATKERDEHSLSRFVFKASYARWGESDELAMHYCKEVQSDTPHPFMPFDDRAFEGLQRLASERH